MSEHVTRPRMAPARSWTIKLGVEKRCGSLDVRDGDLYAKADGRRAACFEKEMADHMMQKLIVALVTLVFFTIVDRAFANSTAPTSAAVQEIFQRYSPRLQTLTPAKVEGIWRHQAEREPWFQGTSVFWKAERMIRN